MTRMEKEDCPPLFVFVSMAGSLRIAAIHSAGFDATDGWI